MEIQGIGILFAALGVNFAVVSPAVLVVLAVLGFVKVRLPKKSFVIPKINFEVNIVLLLGFVLSMLFGGLAQYAPVLSDGLTNQEWASVLAAGVLTFLLSSGTYDFVDGFWQKLVDVYAAALLGKNVNPYEVRNHRSE